MVFCPSPELGLENIFEKDSAERFRALCVETLKGITEHSFLSDSILIERVNKKIENLPEWKVATFKKKFFEVDFDFLSNAINIRNHENNSYIYLKETWEDERFIEEVIKDLSNRPNIRFTIPVEKKFF
jgi:exodeoxyribonuclease V alpha subunit